MSRPIKIYYGEPSRGEVCRSQQARVIAYAQKIARHSRTKKYAAKYLKAALARDSSECIAATDPRFAQFVGLPVDDLGVLLQYQEDLIYSCEKWKQ